MAYSEESYAASKKYKEKNIKRVPLDMQIEAYRELQAAADRAGEKVNTYIKKAIEQRIEREQAQAGGGFDFVSPLDKNSL